MQRNKTSIFMFVCTMVLYKYMKSLRNDVHNLSANAHVRRKISQEFYHDIVDMYIFLYIANEGCHIRINNNLLMDNYSLFNLLFLFSIYLFFCFYLLASSAVGRGFEPRLGPTKDHKIGICFFSAKHAALRRKIKNWLARNQNNVSWVKRHVYRWTVI
jgi:hypothetical protein